MLPFTNMSGDPEQEYFSDGITEDIITELSRFNSLFVIARNSSFTFKGEAVNVTEVGQKLGVAYVVEGSVRKAGNRVRISAQLVEAATGNHLWAERYDRDLEDIFAVQDEVVREIATAVPGQLDVAAMQRVQRKPIENLTAYDLVLRGEHLQYGIGRPAKRSPCLKKPLKSIRNVPGHSAIWPMHRPTASSPTSCRPTKRGGRPGTTPNGRFSSIRMIRLSWPLSPKPIS